MGLRKKVFNRISKCKTYSFLFRFFFLDMNKRIRQDISFNPLYEKFFYGVASIKYEEILYSTLIQSEKICVGKDYSLMNE